MAAIDSAAVPSAAFRYGLPGLVLVDLTRPADSLLPGHTPAQEARCLGAGKHGHVRAGFRNDDLGGLSANPRDGADQVAERTKREPSPDFDPLDSVPRSDGVLWSIVSKKMPARNAWCSLNRPVRASVSSGILCRSRRWASPPAQPHPGCPSIRACSINLRRHRDSLASAGQFDPGILQQLLQPLDLTAPFPGEHHPGSGSGHAVPGSALVARTRPGPVRERQVASHTAPSTSVLPPGMPGMPGVDQHQLEPGISSSR